MKNRLTRTALLLAAMACTATGALAQNTAFTYQGSLTTTGAPASGNYDFIFKLYDSASGGTLLGVVTALNVTVSQGVFAANLDFGSQFTGANRWLEISTRSANSGAYVVLNSRHQLLPSPYAIGLSLPYVGVANSASPGISVTNTSSAGITGINTNSTSFLGAGVVGLGSAENGNGVTGVANSGTSAYGVFGEALEGTGVYGYSDTGTGVTAQSQSGNGVFASSYSDIAMDAVSGSGIAMRGTSASAAGGEGRSDSGPGLHGKNTGNSVITSAGVVGESTAMSGNGVVGMANLGASAYGVYGQATQGYAGYFSGKVQVIGNLSKAGGSFKIDHPSDPANKYLYHSFVESPDMMNVYNGVVTTDARGYAVVTMPDWFGTLNRDFRYQLTVVDQGDSEAFVQAKIVGGGMHDNQFSLRTSAPNTMVSWQVTGIRQDAWANANRIPVEEDKPEFERGFYLHPELVGLGAEASIEMAKVKAAPAMEASVQQVQPATLRGLPACKK